MWPNPKKGEQPTRITALLIKCREVVAHFRHSHLATETLKKLLAQNDVAEKELIQVQNHAVTSARLIVADLGLRHQMGFNVPYGAPADRATPSA